MATKKENLYQLFHLQWEILRDRANRASARLQIARVSGEQLEPIVALHSKVWQELEQFEDKLLEGLPQSDEANMQLLGMQATDIIMGTLPRFPRHDKGNEETVIESNDLEDTKNVSLPQ